MWFFFNDTATTDIYTYWHSRALHDARPIFGHCGTLPGFGPADLHDDDRHAFVGGLRCDRGKARRRLQTLDEHQDEAALAFIEEMIDEIQTLPVPFVAGRNDGVKVQIIVQSEPTGRAAWRGRGCQ